MGSVEEKKNQTHILLVTFSAQGHINPMLRLGKRLASKGLHVTLATNSSTGLPTSATAIDGIHVEFFSDGLPLDYDRKGNMDFYMNTLGQVGPINLTTLIQNHHSQKFSCILITPFVPWAADVAAALGIPCAMLWIQPSILYAIYHHYYNHLSEFPTIPNPDVIVELPGLPLLQKEDLPSFVLPSNPFLSFDRILTEIFQNMHKLKWVLGNSFMELEKDVTESMNVAGMPIWPVGPIVPPVVFGKDEELDGDHLDLLKSEDNCIGWLNKQEPSSVIYISFGSIINFTEKEMESIAFGLKQTNRPFLWVIKDEHLQFGFSEEIKEQGLFVKWSPQSKVLAHSSVGCFLSHCGWNSLLEAITAGVPVIAYPQWTDQPTNAKLVTDILRVGVRLRKNQDGELTGEKVERCIEEIMTGPRSEEFKKNAAELKRAAQEAVAEGGSSDRNIQLFVDEIVCACS